LPLIAGRRGRDRGPRPQGSRGRELGRHRVLGRAVGAGVVAGGVGRTADRAPAPEEGRGLPVREEPLSHHDAFGHRHQLEISTSSSASYSQNARRAAKRPWWPFPSGSNGDGPIGSWTTASSVKSQPSRSLAYTAARDRLPNSRAVNASSVMNPRSSARPS